MPLISPKQSRPARKEYELLKTNTENPLRRLLWKLGDSSEENTTNPTAHQKPSCCCCQNKISADATAVLAATEQEDVFPRFGPCYGKDKCSMKAAKEDAWRRILNATPDEESSVRGIYLSAIKRVEKEARDSYEPTILKSLKKSEFQQMMLIDGCFFLQLALYILGGSGIQLGYPEKHVYFGKPVEKDQKRNNQWIEAMFFAGNQIPYVIIRELMRQSFFQNVIAKGKENGIWVLPFGDLPKTVLYLFVVSPEIEKKNSKSSSCTSYYLSKLMCPKPAPCFGEEPSDLLHALHSLVLGSGDAPIDRNAVHATYDLEAGTDDPSGNYRFPSASEVEQLGITLRKAEKGIRGIYFKEKWFIWAYLYVPPFTLDANTELILQNLKNYEIKQQLGESKCEVASYLRLMSDLIQTQRDVKILEDTNIIKVGSDVKRDILPEMLNRLALSDQEIGITPNLRFTRQQVVKYSSHPWRLVSLAFIFALVQTVFTVLGFFLHGG